MIPNTMGVGFVTLLAAAGLGYTLWGMVIFAKDVVLRELMRDKRGRGSLHSSGRVSLQIVGIMAWIALTLLLLLWACYWLGTLVSGWFGWDR